LGNLLYLLNYRLQVDYLVAVSCYNPRPNSLYLRHHRWWFMLWVYLNNLEYWRFLQLININASVLWNVTALSLAWIYQVQPQGFEPSKITALWWPSMAYIHILFKWASCFKAWNQGTHRQHGGLTSLHSFPY
jgi:hypothetical protein